ncbi:MAG: molybdopterin-dependent oxidoreductase [Deltaproteobacteria bacterium]|nr:molybdopterin-dependent oxidoreductase [Candidatus Deferrimicrobium borealis]
MKITRRNFLQMLGITGAAAGGISHVWAIPDQWVEKLQYGPRIETWMVSTCSQCPGGCGIRVRSIDEIPVRIFGNPIAPVNSGFTCPMGEAGLELLYHPDRIRQPMRRKGKKGESSWEPISWEEALGQISKGFQGLLKKNQADRFGFIFGDRNTLLTHFAGDFVARTGSANFFPWRAPGINELGFWQAFEEFPPLAFDLNKTDYLLTFGTNLLEGPPSPVYFNRLYGKLKESRPRTGLKMVHVDARMSQAGKNATEWVQIRPGSMGVLALGMAYVILRDKNIDEEFIARYTQDFRGGKEDFPALVSRYYPPDKVSAITGVPPETLLRLAREFSSSKAPLALSGGVSDRSETALFTQWAVASLNALSRSFSVKGLWREPVPLPWGPTPVPSVNTRSGAFSLKPQLAPESDRPGHWASEELPHLRSAGKLPDLDMLMIAQVDPLYLSTDQKPWQEWLSRIPQVLQFATLIDDTSPYADLVLPTTTYLEQWDITLPVPNLPFSQLGLQQPIVPPLNGARPIGDVLLQLATETGVTLLPEKSKSYAGYVEARMKPIFASGKGTPYFEAVSLNFLEELRKLGWQVYSYPAFADFWRLLQEKGGWWDPGEYPEAEWKKRKKFTFPTVARFDALLKERVLLRYGQETQKGDTPLHTLLEAPSRKTETPDSFLLAPFTTLMNMTGEGASQPLLQEISGLIPRVYWKPWAEMHPERAKKLSLQDGDLIRVVSVKGSVTLSVKVVPTVSSEILAVPFGKGHKESGRYAKNIGTNPVALIDPLVDPLSGRTSWQSTRVRVEKVNK